eukprot:CAMPEP_0115430462 /NCGR_PEP_ID=MMETSP0271-20121206/31059_1 /TAXON_ID=71861 /ORGANISM="Scrippsiella trochoidea, Strain CCMP3099" /LENGTH=114 /DNA_ID=CAMNT_0002855695 /DNA_START=528 /DNA_END=870 /DNA_ORIENTATION=+
MGCADRTLRAATGAAATADRFAPRGLVANSEQAAAGDRGGDEEAAGVAPAAAGSTNASGTISLVPLGSCLIGSRIRNIPVLCNAVARLRLLCRSGVLRPGFALRSKREMGGPLE